MRDKIAILTQIDRDKKHPFIGCYADDYVQRPIVLDIYATLAGLNAKHDLKLNAKGVALYKVHVTKSGREYGKLNKKDWRE